MTFPSTFYKYMGVNTAALVLANGKLRWSSPLVFNDVAEFQRMPRFEPSLVVAQPLLVKLIADVAYGDAVIERTAQLGGIAPSTLSLEWRGTRLSLCGPTLTT